MGNVITPISHAVILLAGTGSRLKSLTDATHKSLLKVGSETFLERMIRQLSQAGIKHFHLALGYRANDVRNFVERKFSDLRVSFHNNPRYQTTNNAYSLSLVLERLKTPFLLLDGDLMMSDSLVQYIMKQTSQQSFIVCDTRTERLNAEAMKCVTNDRNEILLLSKKIPITQAQGEAIGIACFQKDWLEPLKKNIQVTMQQSEKQNNLYYEDVVVSVLATQKAPSPLACVPTGNQDWIEVDSLQDFEEAKRMFG